MSLARLFLVFFLWALCFPLIEVGRVDVSPLRFATMRAILAGAVLLGTAVILRKPWPRTRRVWLKIAWIGFGATSLGFWGMFEAGRWVAPGLATVLAHTQPLIAAVLAVIFLRER
jgi:drug/metabolite transporter (DMT)-like permease